MNFAHRDPVFADMNFFRSTDGPGGDANFGSGGNVCQRSSPQSYCVEESNSQRQASDIKAVRSNPSLDIILLPGDQIEVPQSFW